MTRASAALRGTIRSSGGPSPVSAPGPARGAPGHRGHCRVGPVEQFRRPGGWVMAFSGDSEAMHKQPGQRQCDGQQQPSPQPGRQKNPHAQRPFFFPPGGRLGLPALMCGTSYRTELCISGVAGSQVGRTAGQVPCAFAALPAARRANRYADEAGPRALRVMSMTSCCSWLPGRMVIRTTAAPPPHQVCRPTAPPRPSCCQAHLACPRL